MTVGNDTERAALATAAERRSVLALEPERKRPHAKFAPHGVHSATCDRDTIKRWFRCEPLLNYGTPTGSPWQQVLDIDDLTLAGPELLRRLDALGGPVVATPRPGRHYPMRGEARGTIVLPYGELRGTGSYTVGPGSIVGGKEYVQTATGPLPPVPDFIASVGHGAGRGEHQPPAQPIKAGEGRWPHLRDVAVHLVRGGIVDERKLLALIRAAFEADCEPYPPPQPGALEQLAEWAASSRIADRERNVAALLVKWEQDRS